MGYETKAYIVSASANKDCSEFVKCEDNWFHAWREFDEHGKTKAIYHYSSTGNDKTYVDLNSKIIKRSWASVIATVDLCKLGKGNNVPKNESEFYIYGDDGNTVIIEDSYGDKLNQMTLDQAIEFFTPQAGYRRVDLLLANLNSVKEHFKFEDIYVLFFGH